MGRDGGIVLALKGCAIPHSPRDCRASATKPLSRGEGFGERVTLGSMNGSNPSLTA